MSFTSPDCDLPEERTESNSSLGMQLRTRLALGAGGPEAFEDH